MDRLTKDVLNSILIYKSEYLYLYLYFIFIFLFGINNVAECYIYICECGVCFNFLNL